MLIHAVYTPHLPRIGGNAVQHKYYDFGELPESLAEIL